MTQTQNPTTENPALISRLMFCSTVFVAALLIISLGGRLVASWRYYGDLDHNSPGTWMCMAADARDGVLYRNIVSEIGYGGTRYAPLFPVVIAGFMRAGINPITSGFLAGLIATAVTISGLFVLMRRLATPTAVAGAMAIFFLAATCTRTIILGIKGDLLPLGLALWGLAAVVYSSEKHDSNLGLIAGAVCFVLALATKVTSVFGIAAATIWLLFRGKYRQAAILCVAWVVGVVIVLLVTQWASDGRAGTILKMCAGGGGSFTRVLKGPRLLLATLAGQDKTLLVLWLIAFFLIAAIRQWTSLPAILLLITTAGTAMIYGSPGTHLNHLVDLDAAAILVIATLSMKTRMLQSPVLAIVMLLICMAAVACWRQVREIRRVNVRGQMERALADTKRSSVDGPILSEDPLLPMLEGERPYMLDPFMFRAIRKRSPAIADRFWRDLDGGHFKAVILHGPPSDPEYSSDEYDFGPGFIDRLEKEYVLTSVRGDFYVLLPKP